MHFSTYYCFFSRSFTSEFAQRLIQFLPVRSDSLVAVEFESGKRLVIEPNQRFRLFRHLLLRYISRQLSAEGELKTLLFIEQFKEEADFDLEADLVLNFENASPDSSTNVFIQRINRERLEFAVTHTEAGLSRDDLVEFMKQQSII